MPTSFAKLTTEETIAPQVHPGASVAPDAVLGAGVVVHPSAVVESWARIGAGTVLHAHVTVGRETTIGEDCVLYPHSSVREKCALGDRVVLESGSAVGSDGFGFATNGGVHHKIPQAGRVELEDDVWVGANATVDRATMGLTRLRRGVRVEGLAQIGHNVEVGEGTTIESQAGIAGSTKIGSCARIGKKVGVLGHSSIGDRATVADFAGVIKAIKAGEHVAGVPGTPVETNAAIQEALVELPALLRQLQEMRRRVDQLEAEALAQVPAGS